MKILDAFPSTYLKAADLGGRKIRLVIENVDYETVGDSQKPVVKFKGKDKGLVLNKTNAMMIASAYGPETDDWLGKEIALVSEKVAFQGEIKDALRVKIIEPVLPTGDDVDPDNDVPF